MIRTAVRNRIPLLYVLVRLNMATIPAIRLRNMNSKLFGDLIEQNIEALQPIAQMAGSLGLALVFENYKTPFDRVSTFNILLEEVPGLKVHLDFGHTNMGEDDAEMFCRLLGRHIMHVHFSDNRSTEDHHMPLGVGSVDWKKAVSALKMIEYDGTITLEIFCDDDTVLFQYLDISRRLLLDLWNQ